jgi:orotate phosphoribosyltransferase
MSPAVPPPQRDSAAYATARILLERKAGALVAHNFVIFHYGILPAGIARLAEAGVKLHALATWWDVVAVAEAEGHLDGATIAKVRAYLADPGGWQAARGAAQRRTS